MDRAALLHQHMNPVMYKTVDVPEGMVRWYGDRDRPIDWDGGYVLTRCGLWITSVYMQEDTDWVHVGNPLCPPMYTSDENATPSEIYEAQRRLDLIAYTRKGDVNPAPF